MQESECFLQTSNICGVSLLETHILNRCKLTRSKLSKSGKWSSPRKTGRTNTTECFDIYLLRQSILETVVNHFLAFIYTARARVAQWVRLDYLTTHTNLLPIRRGFAPDFVNYKKGALDSQPQVIMLTSCLPMVGGSFRVLRLLSVFINLPQDMKYQLYSFLILLQ
jgi:hypothetical protein